LVFKSSPYEQLGAGGLMTDSIQQYAEGLTRRIGSFETSYQIRNIGKVIEAGDGIAQVEGLTEVRAQELVKFSNNTLGIAFNYSRRLFNHF
jgi:F-type H+-transporting ATPase subunit alpha